MNQKEKIYIAGHRGLVGSALLRHLDKLGFRQVLTRTKAELDLTDSVAVTQFFKTEKPDYVFLAAAKVGGIMANKQYPADFIYENLQIQNNIIHQSYLSGVKKLLFLGSSCIYPKLAPQPIKEEYLLTGPLEETNDAYAIAKIAGIKMCQSYRKQHNCDFISVMPTNLYGPNDNFDLETSHVLPALIRRFHEAKQNHLNQVTLWGTGTPRREFIHVDDLARACLFLMENYSDSTPMNIGTGEDISILELAKMTSAIVGYEGQIVFDINKPDGTPRKLLDVTKLSDLGFKAEIGLEDGIRMTYEWFKNNPPK